MSMHNMGGKRKALGIVLGFVVIVIVVAVFAATNMSVDPSDTANGQPDNMQSTIDEPTAAMQSPSEMDGAAYAMWVSNLDDRYVIEHIGDFGGDEEYAKSLAETLAKLGRDLTDEEAELLASGIKAQMVADSARAEGRLTNDLSMLTEEELAVLRRSGELTFGDPAVSANDNPAPGMSTQSSGSGSVSSYPGGSYSQFVGEYPISRFQIQYGDRVKLSKQTCKEHNELVGVNAR